MSLSYADIKPQSDLIQGLLKDLPGVMVALETNKRLIVRCEARDTGITLTNRIKAAGFSTEIAMGRKTRAYYVNTAFNQPH